MSVKQRRRRIGWYTDWKGRRRPITIPETVITLPPEAWEALKRVDRRNLAKVAEELEERDVRKRINDFLDRDYFSRAEYYRLPAIEAILIGFLHPKMRDIVEKWRNS